MTKPWKKHRTKPAFEVKAPEPAPAPEPEPEPLPEKPNPYAHTRILRGEEIPPVCGRIPSGGGYGRYW
jgi:hypothetical protein